jgi:hypothetical protein
MATHNRLAVQPCRRRGLPARVPGFDLRDYATRRGLEFLDHGTPAGFRAALPCDQELQSNVLRGTLPGGAYGVLANEGLQIGWTDEDPDWGGTFYGTRVTAKGEVGGVLALVPVVNWFVGSPATATVRVPCTFAAVRVPETAGTLTHLRIDRRRWSPPFSFGKRTKLAELVGEKGWDLYAGTKPEPGVVARLVAEPVAGLLRAHTGDGLFQAVVWWGTLVVRRNGFLRSPEELDELGQAASLLARRLRDVCLPLAEPQRFQAELPPPPDRDTPTHRLGSSSKAGGAGGPRRPAIASDWSRRTRLPITAPSPRCRYPASPARSCAEPFQGWESPAGSLCTVSATRRAPRS